MTTGTVPTVNADLEALTRSIVQGAQRDPALLRRIQERAEVVRQRILSAGGVLDVSVDLVREGREE